MSDIAKPRTANPRRHRGGGRRRRARSRAHRRARPQRHDHRAAQDARHDDAGRAPRAGPADQRPQGQGDGGARPRAATRSRTPRSTRGSTPRAVDVTLPVREPPTETGRIHPISQVIDELTAIFADMGFAVAEGPDIETDDLNFTKLNIPEGHPAREMHDTFFFNPKPDGSRLLLRTHTSPVQIRTMLSAEAADPRDHPRPHLPHRLRPDPHADVPSGRGAGDRQGLASRPPEMDPRGVHEGVLRGRPGEDAVPAVVLPVHRAVDRSRHPVPASTRTRCASAKATTGWRSSAAGWCIRTCLRNCGLDPDEYQGFAWGMGIDRIAMLKYGMPDLRAFFDADVRWLSHYGFRPLDLPTLAGGIELDEIHPLLAEGASRHRRVGRRRSPTSSP